MLGGPGRGGRQQRDAGAQEVTAERAAVRGQRLSKDRGPQEAAGSSSPTHEILQQTNKHQDPPVPAAAEQTQRALEVGTALESKGGKQGWETGA